ncbi:MAG TPA: transcription termination factor Rho, partial [Clostridiaceae bacterium]|nr:transcription termination factor Rho [Clostridiaceae bacterium]HCL49958.1 transcription termination factor Rho [Clostridiaceae bacterium]
KYRKSELIEAILNIEEGQKNEKSDEDITPIEQEEMEEDIVEEKQPSKSSENLNLKDIDANKRGRIQELIQDSDTVEGVFEQVENQSYGFLRTDNYQQGPRDIYVSPSQIRKFG